MQQYYRFADVYGRSAYGSSEYSCEGATTCTTDSGSASGGLADTGMYVVGFVTLACLIVFLALMVRIWRRPRAQLQVQEIETEDEQSIRKEE